MPASPPTLRDMIQAAIDAGQTYEQLAKRVQDGNNESVSGAYLNKIALGKVARMPSVGHLRAIAVAIGQPYERVRQAAIRQWLPAEDPEEDVEQKAERLTKLTEELLGELRQQRAADRGSA